MPVEVSFSSVFTAQSARTIYGPSVRHRTRSTLDVAYRHKVVLQGPQWLGCLWGIAASRPDAVAAMKKPIGSV